MRSSSPRDDRAMMRFARAGSARIGAVLAFAFVATVSCVESGPAQWSHPGAAEWNRSAAALQALRDAAPRAPYVDTLRATLWEPRSGRAFGGRGAIAVAPGEALRMILVAAAGTTLLDAWATPGRWRFAVPPLDVVRRGLREDPSDLPVGFLRWWFFAPFQGLLIATAAESDGWLWVLRYGDSTIELRAGRCEGGQRLRASRRQGRGFDEVEECRTEATRVVHYVERTSGLRVDLTATTSSASADAEAFRDPDGPARAQAQGAGGAP